MVIESNRYQIPDMKKRIAKNLDNRPLSMRNFNKFVYLACSIQKYWSVDTKNKCYVRTKDGRVMIYSEVLPDGRIKKGDGYYLWNDIPKPSWIEYFNQKQ